MFFLLILIISFFIRNIMQVAQDKLDRQLEFRLLLQLRNQFQLKKNNSQMKCILKPGILQSFFSARNGTSFGFIFLKVFSVFIGSSS